MAVNPLPPQAYTKETLQKAYTWLLTQNPSVKEMASTQDMLVSLYLKAQRSGDASLDTPSIQNFKQELKSLANLMGDFQTNPSGQTQSSYAQPQQMPQSAGYVAAPQMPHQTMTPSSPHQVQPLSQASLQGLDAQTLQALAEVRTTLNLSSDLEAVRALVALGHKVFKKIQS